MIFSPKKRLLLELLRIMKQNPKSSRENKFVWQTKLPEKNKVIDLKRN